MQDPMTGLQKEITLMRPWANLTNELDTKIPVRHILLETSPTQDVVGLYLHKLEKEDVVQDLVQEMLGDPEQLEEYLRNIVESDLDAAIPEEEIEPEQDEENVQMNFNIPPGLFLGFLMNGIVSLDPENQGAEFDIEEFLKMKNEGSPKRKPRRPTDIEDYFRDWNPEP